MKKSSYFMFQIVLALVWTLGMSADKVYACSGGAPLTIEGLLNSSDYLVKAQRIESDDAGQNVIIHVESYLAGGIGPEYMLFARTNPIYTEYILAGRSTGGDCLGLFSELSPSDTFYAFMSRNDNGSYTAVSTLFNPYLYSFPETESTEEVFLEGGYQNGEEILEDSADRGTGQQVTESEFLAIIQSVSGQEPSHPDTNSLYPLKSPLLITAGDQAFILPVDWQNPFIITEENTLSASQPLTNFGFSDALRCAEHEGEIIISPDSLNIAVLGADSIICLTWGHTLEGQSVLFSSSSDALAVWNHCELSIYSTGYPILLQDWYELESINSTSLIAQNCEDYYGLAVWSPNGAYLVYSDTEGLWLWDVFNPQSEPNLLVSGQADRIVLPHFFSPLGRYLNYTSEDTTAYIDIFSGSTRPNGLFSPDERILINFDSEPRSTGYEICTMLDECAYGNPMYISIFDETIGEVTALYLPSDIRFTEWESNASFLQLTCVADEENLCGIFRWFPTFSGWNNEFISLGTGFDYDSSTGVLAIIQDESSILVDGNKIDLSYLTSEQITAIRWLPSLFYYD